MLKKKLGNDLGGRRVVIVTCEASEHHHENSIRCVCSLKGKVVTLGSLCKGIHTYPVVGHTIAFCGSRPNLRVRPSEVRAVEEAPDVYLPIPPFLQSLWRVLSAKWGNRTSSRMSRISSQAGD